MGRILIFLIGVFIFCAARLCAQNTVVKGQVRSACCDDMAMSDVTLISVSQDISYKRTYHVSPDRSGNFHISEVPFGMYNLTIAGVNHQHISVPYFCLSTDSVFINARLQHTQYQENFKTIEFIGNHGADAKEMSLATMTYLTHNGKYAFYGHHFVDTLRYELRGIGTSRVTKNGTDQDFFIYDGDGDYFSCKVIKDSSYTITFDPKELVRNTTQGSLDIQPANILKANRVRQAFYADLKSYDSLTLASPDNNLAQEQFVNNLLSSQINEIRREEDPLIKQALYLNYLSTAVVQLKGIQNFTVDTSVVIEAFAGVPYNSPWWQTTNAGLAVYASSMLRERQFPSEYLKKMYSHHPDTSVRTQTLYNLVEYAYYIGAAETGKDYFTILENLYPNTKDGRDARTTFYADSLRISRLPAFSLRDAFDTTITYTDNSFKGKYLLVDFWATWCKPCVEEMANLHKAFDMTQSAIKDRVEFLSISLDKNIELVRLFREKKWKMPWGNIWLPGGFTDSFSEKMDVTALPTTYLFNPLGLIVASGQSLRGNSLKTTLEKFVH